VLPDLFVPTMTLKGINDSLSLFGELLALHAKEKPGGSHPPGLFRLNRLWKVLSFGCDPNEQGDHTTPPKERKGKVFSST
jgi:hypothetical protein